MIDNFSLAISHGLILLVMWRLLSRPDLDDDKAAAPAPSLKPERGIRSFLKGRRGA
jgi:hypothetical protein